MPSEDPWPGRPLFPAFLSLAPGGAEESGAFPPPQPLLFLSFLFLQQGSMDLSKVGEKILGSVRSARSLALLPSSDHRRPEVPERAAAAAAVARALAGIPPHERVGLPSSSAELVSIYGSKSSGQAIEELEEEFYKEEFDAVRNIFENIPPEEVNVEFFEKKATLRLAQLEYVTEQLSRHVVEHHEKMVKGMQLVMEVQQDLKIASVISTNGRRHIMSSLNEVSRDLVVPSSAKRKQFLLDMIPILTELRHALDMRIDLEVLIEEGNYFKAFQVLSEYLQVLESFSELSVTQEMNRGVESWLAKTLQKLDSLLLSVCQEFKAESYRTVVDAYALIGDIGGLAEKIQSFFMQELLAETHSALRDLIFMVVGSYDPQGSRVTYSDLCLQIPESKFRQCLLMTLGILFKLLCSYYAIMSYQPERKDLGIETSNENNNGSETADYPTSTSDVSSTQRAPFKEQDQDLTANSASTSESAFSVLRNDAVAFVSQSLSRGRKNLWQLTTSRISVLLSCSAVYSTSTFQFLKNYEDINFFILAGEGFCGVEAFEFRQRLKCVCESYVSAFHRQNIYALKMVLEKETWSKISPDSTQVIGLAGLIGDGAPVIVPKDGGISQPSAIRSVESGKGDGFSQWLTLENPFFLKLSGSNASLNKTVASSEKERESSIMLNDKFRGGSSVNGKPYLDDENEDLLADYIDEDSQLPSRTSKSLNSKNRSSQWNNEEVTAHTGSSLCLLRLMDNYGRLMQKLQLVNIEFFKGICELFELFFHFIYETFCQLDAFSNGKGLLDLPSKRLKIALSRATQNCDKYMKPQLASSVVLPASSTFPQIEVSPTSPTSHSSITTFGLKERCVAAENISLVAKILHKSKSHLQSMLMQQHAAVEEFYANMVDVVPDLIEHLHRKSSRILLHINGYVDRIANAKWELKDLGLEHNGYVDLLLGEFKHYKTRLAHGGIQKEVQDLLVEYGLENVAETLVEGLSRIKKCTDEGRALMSLDLQVLINGLQHFVSVDVKPKMQIVDTFIKAYYLPETEFVHWARTHPEYSKSQVIGLVNLVATMKSWKRKSRLEVIERIEAGV